MPQYRMVTEIGSSRESQMVELPGPPEAGQRVTIDGREWVVEGPNLIFEDGKWRQSIDPAWLCRPA
jgi:hypothetical protein